MTPLISLVPLKLVSTSSGTFGVLAGVVSGVSVAGEVGGILGGFATVAALAFTVAWNNAKKRRDYDNEIRSAEKRGHDARDDEIESLRSDMEFFRGQYAALLQQRAGAPATPLPPLRSVRDHRNDDTETASGGGE